MIFDKIDWLLERLRNDNESGASEFIENALETIRFYLDTIDHENKNIKEKFIQFAKKIIDTRPSMAPLTNVIGFLIADSKKLTKKNILQNLERFRNIRKEINQKIEENFLNFSRNQVISSGKATKIMLISYSSTILKLLKKLKNNNIEVYVLESRPLFEGRKTAKKLSDFFQVHLIIDAALGFFIDSMDLVLVGIDSILKDGTLINKIGTYSLAVLSQENNVDFYAVGSSLKYNLKSHFGLEVLIEEKDNNEILDSNIQNLQVHNYYFDKTPPEYLSGIISDLGNLSVRQ
ncbi:MAG: translation initiation factor eIF-2B, partial [Promethearchaeia archaeon]